jgi:predicted hotdog family 3-hydroxylacyl-ACP dehydratase
VGIFKILMDMTDLKDIDILTLLPQRLPFIVVDRLIYFDMNRVETQLMVREDNLFCEDGVLIESGIVENIAQTCAARMGYINTYISQESVKLGYLGSIRNLEILTLPKVGQIVQTRVDVVEEVFQLTLVKAVVKVGDAIVAKCEMKISITNIDKVEE